MTLKTITQPFILSIIFCGIFGMHSEAVGNESSIEGDAFLAACKQAIPKLKKSCVENYYGGVRDRDGKLAETECNKDALSANGVCETFAAIEGYKAIQGLYSTCLNSKSGTIESNGNATYYLPGITSDLMDCAKKSIQKNLNKKRNLVNCEADLKNLRATLELMNSPSIVSDRQFKAINEILFKIDYSDPAGGATSAQ